MSAGRSLLSGSLHRPHHRGRAWADRGYMSRPPSSSHPSLPSADRPLPVQWHHPTGFSWGRHQAGATEGSQPAYKQPALTG